MPNGNFNGDALVSFPRFFTNDRIKDDPIKKNGNYYKPANGTYSLGLLVYLSIPFSSRKFPFGEKNLSIYIPFKIFGSLGQIVSFAAARAGVT